MTPEEQRAADVATATTEKERIAKLEKTLDYVASCFHVAVHGIKDAATWQECDRQPCRVANGRLPSVRRVCPHPTTDATPL